MPTEAHHKPVTNTALLIIVNWRVMLSPPLHNKDNGSESRHSTKEVVPLTGLWGLG